MRRLEIADRKIIEVFMRQMNPVTSELTFTNLYMWRHAYKYQLIESGEYLWLLADLDVPFTMMPLGDYSNKEALIDSIAEMRKLMLSRGYDLRIERADNRLKEIVEAAGLKVATLEDRNTFDYVYDFEELKKLEGNKFHKKKNHVNKFMKTYKDWCYEPIDEEIIEDLQHATMRWFNAKGEVMNPSLNLERKAILSAFEHFHDLAYEGGVIRINGQIEAFTFGEALNDDTYVVHIEKANRQFDGLYPMINQQFLQHVQGNYKYVNREQDLGIKGIRQAKLSYKPAELIEKHSILFF